MTPVCQSASEPTVSWLSTRTQIALTACACAGASAFLYAVDPGRHSFYPQCLLYRATGIYCAGCGATRALHALLHGNILAALHDNALFIGALPFFAWLVVPHMVQAWRNNAWPECQVKSRTLVRFGTWAVVLMLAFMALRNLPGWPFDWLKPLAG